jgi:hypothetical protein
MTEREQFEAWIAAHPETGMKSPWDIAWAAWSARAALEHGPSGAAPAQPEERVLLRRGTNLGAMGVGTGPWMQVFDQNDTYNDAEFSWATVERIK